MERKVVFGGAVALWILCVACGDGEESGPKGVSASLERMVEQICETSRKCCVADGYSISGLGNCEEKTREQWDLADLEAMVASGRLGFNQQRFNHGCLAALNRTEDSCAAADLRDFCLGSFEGQRVEGESCAAGIECKAVPGAATGCVRPQMDKQNLRDQDGSCMTWQRGKRDDPCVQSCTDETCHLTAFSLSPSGEAGLRVCIAADGLYCDPDEGTCQQLASIGASCRASEDCVAGYYCNEDRECAKRSVAGESCTTHDQCDGPNLCANEKCVPLPVASPQSCAGS